MQEHHVQHATCIKHAKPALPQSTLLELNDPANPASLKHLLRCEVKDLAFPLESMPPLYQHPAVMDVQAMIYAETGQFAEAIQTEQQAIKLSEADGQTEDLALMQKRLARYQQHQPWRESFKKN